ELGNGRISKPFQRPPGHRPPPAPTPRARRSSDSDPTPETPAPATAPPTQTPDRASRPSTRARGATPPHRVRPTRSGRPRALLAGQPAPSPTTAEDPESATRRSPAGPHTAHSRRRTPPSSPGPAAA